MPTLQEQAIRLRRTKWSNAWMLADELYLMLMSQDVPTTGPTTVNITNAGQDPFTIGPFPDLNLPRVDLDFPNLTPQPTQTDRPDGTQQTGGQATTSRLMLPGKVSGVSGSTATVTLYPNGLIGETEAVSATLLDATNPPEVGDWVSVYRVSNYEITANQIGGNTNTELQLSSRDHLVLPGGGRKKVFHGKVISGGGPVYQATIYKNGISGSPREITVQQLQISPAATIPPETYALILEVVPPMLGSSGNEIGGTYVMQVPVWLEG